MSLQDHFFVLLGWIGATQSEFLNHWHGWCWWLKENLRSGEMSVCGDQWPIFLYAHHTYDADDPWCGLLRSCLLVYLSGHIFHAAFCSIEHHWAYKHIFMSPSSVNKEPKAMWSGNARLHSMSSVTIALMAYIATQVHWCHTFCNWILLI